MIVGAVCLLAVSSASASPVNTNPQTRKPCGHQVVTHRHGLADFERVANHSQDPERLAHFRRCARTPAKQRRMAKLQQKLELAARFTPYDCGRYGDFAVPCYIVACESRYSWHAANPSGAAGPYQLMPEWGAPWPVRSATAKLAHHRIAAGLWRGGTGASNWVCA